LTLPLLATDASEREALESARARLSSSLSEGRRLLTSIEARLAELPAPDIRLCRLPVLSVASIRRKVASATEALPSHGYQLSAAKREVVCWRGGLRTLEIQFPVQPGPTR
jgi:hypothetical protein